MTIQLTVRGTDGLRKWLFDEWNCLVAVASISAQPESINEFLAAIRRYQPADAWSATGDPVECIQDATTSDGQWCLVDLASRSVISGPHFELPDRRSALQADGDEHGQGANVIWLDTPPDWLFEPAAADWISTVDQRAAQIGDERRFDGRAVLYGPDMLRLIADRILIAAASGVPNARRHEFNRNVHEDWLMTARADLCGQTPRQWMLKDHEHIGWELQHRTQQWQMQGFAVPPLDVFSVAYCYAAFGTSEVVIYFDLLRSLLNECWQQSDSGVFDSDRMVERLTSHMQSFLDQPPEDDGCPISRAERIECERRRMPLTADQTHLDCTCSICHGDDTADFGSPPAFTAIDDSHLELEDAFAFSMITSRDDWERQQADDRIRLQQVQQLQSQPTAPDVAVEDSIPLAALQTTTPILNVVVFRSPGPADTDIESFSADHAREVSSRPLGGGLGYLILAAEDFDRVADGIFSGDHVGTAAAVLHFMGPNAADLILQPQNLDYCWIVTDHTPFERVLTLQIVMRPHLLE